MSTRATARATRPKKLTPKQNVQIFREEQVEDIIEIDTGRGPIETGVEKAEESEYHLQQVIKASQAAARDEAQRLKDVYIPTPPTIASDVQYDVLYPTGYEEPATYIRSSATVEDCQGIAYNMDEEDDVALKKINASLPSNTSPCSEDVFEEVMNFFEETAQAKQPFAAVDNPPVLPIEELEEQYDDTVTQQVRIYAKIIYPHWHARRTAIGNRSLGSRLKFETGAESDDTDPYVCFRRRELRQVRKTRNRDAQSAEKLRRLRMELETARHMLAAVKTREIKRKEQLELDKLLFEQRQSFKDTKRKLNLKGDDELLINVKKQKPNPTVDPTQAALGQHLRLAGHVGQASELRSLEDVRSEKDRQIELEIRTNVEKHIRWNEGFVDKTKAPLSPLAEPEYFDESAHFLEAMPAAEYLPTPPASISEEETQVEKPDIEMKDAPPSRASTPAFRYASPVEDDNEPPMPSFRRRIGRGGRVLIDRRIPSRKEKEDRFKFDDSDDDDDRDITIGRVEEDIFSRMAHRAYLLVRSASAVTADAQRRTHIEGGTSRSPPQAGTQAQQQQTVHAGLS